MKKLYLLLCICSLYSLGYAQLPSEIKRAVYASHQSFGVSKPKGMFFSKCEKLDTCILRVTYNVLFVNDTLQKEKKENDTEIVEIGKRISHCYSYLLFQQDSLISALKKKGVAAFPVFKKYIIPEELFIYSGKNQIESCYRTPSSLPRYGYQETIPDIRWNLCDEYKSILGYKCQKATCSFRGRSYIAWYTSDIPLKMGPYKFSGLPGLILSISDTNKEYDWECVGLARGNDKTTINKYTYTEKNIVVARDKIRKDVQRFCQDPAGYLATSGMSGDLNSGGKDYSLASGDLPPEPYNPIEKE